MPEPVSIGVGVLTWEYAVKPIVDSIKKEYGEEAKKLLKQNFHKAIAKLPFKMQEAEVIEAEILNADQSILTDEKKFLDFFQNNEQINKIMIEVNKRESNLNIQVDKGIGYIETMHGDINF